jgi:transketolase
LVREALEARRLLAARGISARVVHMRTLEPLDEAAILDAALQSRLTVTIEDHLLTGGLYSIVSELLVRRGLSARVMPIALEKRWFVPGLLDRVLAKEGFTGAARAARIGKAIDA